MRIVHPTARSASDGHLHLLIPAEADTEFEVAVVVQPKASTNEDIATRTPEERGWPPGYFESVVGSIQDDTFVAPTRSPPRPEEVLG